MGSLQAQDMLNHTDLDTALRWHLQGNHFPPLPPALVEPCKKAIELANQAIAMDDSEGWEELIDLPEGLGDRKTGEPKMTVARLVELCHLHDFLQHEEE